MRHQMSNGGISASHWPWFKKMYEIVGNSLPLKTVSEEEKSIGGFVSSLKQTKNNNETTTFNNVFPERSQRLKQSLPETLTRFYPFARMVTEDLHIECNDQGVYYVEAQVSDNLSSFLAKAYDQWIHKLLPFDPNSMESLSETYVVMMQVNFFDCGGIAISICPSHKLIDDHILVKFLKAWAATAHGSSEEVYPSFVAPSLFVQNPLLPKRSSMLFPMDKQGKYVTRRLVFNSLGLGMLKAKAAFASSGFQNPSRIMAVTSLIWKCATEASKARYGSQRSSVLSLLVNLRARSFPPRP
ncbi:hypothetical protein RJ640_011927 [Escallonia rubra]|uniref:Uncharacterized protein n=1 Tax=Escallonia rubra TaxID=112253 RepID=A0AA88RAA3_9ASTE|nr:hypothetical protein RJ640_011927 [Escallonia rubra]